MVEDLKQGIDAREFGQLLSGTLLGLLEDLKKAKQKKVGDDTITITTTALKSISENPAAAEDFGRRNLNSWIEGYLSTEKETPTADRFKAYVSANIEKLEISITDKSSITLSELRTPIQAGAEERAKLEERELNTAATKIRDQAEREQFQAEIPTRVAQAKEAFNEKYQALLDTVNNTYVADIKEKVLLAGIETFRDAASEKELAKQREAEERAKAAEKERLKAEAERPNEVAGVEPATTTQESPKLSEDKMNEIKAKAEAQAKQMMESIIHAEIPASELTAKVRSSEESQKRVSTPEQKLYFGYLAEALEAQRPELAKVQQGVSFLNKQAPTPLSKEEIETAMGKPIPADTNERKAYAGELRRAKLSLDPNLLNDAANLLQNGKDIPTAAELGKDIKVVNQEIPATNNPTVTVVGVGTANPAKTVELAQQAKANGQEELAASLEGAAGQQKKQVDLRRQQTTGNVMSQNQPESEKNPVSVTTETQAQKEAREAKEKADALAREEADRLAKEKEQQDKNKEAEARAQQGGFNLESLIKMISDFLKNIGVNLFQNQEDMKKKEKEEVDAKIKQNPDHVMEQVGKGVESYIRGNSYEAMKKDIEANGGVPSASISMYTDKGKRIDVPMKDVMENLSAEQQTAIKGQFAALAAMPQAEYEQLRGGLQEKAKQEEAARPKDASPARDSDAPERESGGEGRTAPRNSPRSGGSKSSDSHGYDQGNGGREPFLKRSKWGTTLTVAATAFGFFFPPLGVTAVVGAGIGYLASKIVRDPEGAGRAVVNVALAPYRFVKGIFKEAKDEISGSVDPEKQAERQARREERQQEKEARVEMKREAREVASSGAAASVSDEQLVEKLKSLAGDKPKGQDLNEAIALLEQSGSQLNAGIEAYLNADGQERKVIYKNLSKEDKLIARSIDEAVLEVGEQINTAWSDMGKKELQEVKGDFVKAKQKEMLGVS